MYCCRELCKNLNIIVLVIGRDMYINSRGALYLTICGEQKNAMNVDKTETRKREQRTEHV